MCKNEKNLTFELNPEDVYEGGVGFWRFDR